MYVTGPNEVYALASRSGREIWRYTRSGATGRRGRSNGSQGPNRGVAILGDRVFFVSEDAHLICLHRLTGGFLWDVHIVHTPGRYNATPPPLAFGARAFSATT